MFTAFGTMSARKHAEAVSAPSHFKELVGYDTVQGRPLNTSTKGYYTPVACNIGQVQPASAKMSPFVMGLKY